LQSSNIRLIEKSLPSKSDQPVHQILAQRQNRPTSTLSSGIQCQVPRRWEDQRHVSWRRIRKSRCYDRGACGRSHGTICAAAAVSSGQQGSLCGEEESSRAITSGRNKTIDHHHHHQFDSRKIGLRTMRGVSRKRGRGKTRQTNRSKEVEVYRSKMKNTYYDNSSTITITCRNDRTPSTGRGRGR